MRMELVAFWPMRWDWGELIHCTVVVFYLDIVCVESIGDYDTIHIMCVYNTRHH